ncbi:MAG: hypothetical protein E3J60_04420 [Dehalococcoidia bacterium]|nr:MAG: hypothetical protein E3J60_04420 [Dehalococcoidia bacterium]
MNKKEDLELFLKELIGSAEDDNLAKDSEETMNHEEFVSLIKGQRIHQILVANMFPDGDSCQGEILIEEIVLENGVRILFEGSPRAEIKKGE